MVARPLPPHRLLADPAQGRLAFACGVRRESRTGESDMPAAAPNQLSNEELTMKTIRNALLSATCVVAIGTAAYAQQKDMPMDPGPEKMPIAGKSTIGISVTEAQMVAPGWRATKLIGIEVQNDKKEKIGKVDDLIVSPDGKISAAVIDVGGFLGVDRHRVAVPVGKFKKLEAGKAVLPGATKEELKKVPEFKYTQ
jgi:hypothetical protein